MPRNTLELHCIKSINRRHKDKSKVAIREIVFVSFLGVNRRNFELSAKEDVI